MLTCRAWVRCLHPNPIFFLIVPNLLATTTCHGTQVPDFSATFISLSLLGSLTMVTIARANSMLLTGTISPYPVPLIWSKTQLLVMVCAQTLTDCMDWFCDVTKRKQWDASVCTNGLLLEPTGQLPGMMIEYQAVWFVLKWSSWHVSWSSMCCINTFELVLSSKSVPKSDTQSCNPHSRYKTRLSPVASAVIMYSAWVMTIWENACHKMLW